MRRIAIIECGQVPVGIRDRFPSYPDMFRRLLAPLAPGLEFETVSVVQGAPVPAVEAFDGYLYTGSRHGVLDGLPWVPPLEALIRAAHGLGKPQVGICFGHQLMAQALGGTVEKARQGWGVGKQRYALRRGGHEVELDVAVFHQDQVTVPPPGARVVAVNGFCPYGGLAYGETALTFQFHPEFADPYLAALIDDCDGRVLTHDLAEAARASMGSPTSAGDPVRWMAEVLMGGADGRG